MYTEKKFKQDCDILLLAGEYAFNTQRETGYASYASVVQSVEDVEVMLAAVSKNGWILEHASDNLKNNSDVVLAAGEAAFKFRGQALQRKEYKDIVADATNARVMRAAVAKNGLILEHASEALRADRDVVLAAVAQMCGHSGMPAIRLKADRYVVETAIYKNGDGIAIC